MRALFYYRNQWILLAIAVLIIFILFTGDDVSSPLPFLLGLSSIQLSTWRKNDQYLFALPIPLQSFVKACFIKHFLFILLPILSILLAWQFRTHYLALPIENSADMYIDLIASIFVIVHLHLLVAYRYCQFRSAKIHESLLIIITTTFIASIIWFFTYFTIVLLLISLITSYMMYKKSLRTITYYEFTNTVDK